MENALRFLREAKVELAKVNWPTRKQIVQYTVIVIGISLFTAVFLGGLDYVFGSLVERFLLQ